MRSSRSQAMNAFFTTICVIVVGKYCKGMIEGEAFVLNGGRCSMLARTEKIRFLYGNIGDYDDASFAMSNEDGSYWKLQNDFSMFLTQRSIQSFMFLTSQLRDPETCYWVEEFTQSNLVEKNEDDSSSGDTIPNLSDVSTGKSDCDDDGGPRSLFLLKYHGLAAMDTTRFPTWESYFEEMLQQPSDRWIIASDRPHVMDYTWEIDPSSLCSRILSVREQLSREFAKDLQAVSDMGGQTFEWYWERLRQSRDQEIRGDETQQIENLSIGETGNTPLVDSGSLRGSRQNLLFLEINVDDPTLDHKPSPLRWGNFDLLVLLATEESIHRVLNRWQSKKSEGDLRGAEYVSYEFLENFYRERQHFFQGPLPSYGKADDILEELLSSALSFKSDSTADGNSSSAAVINPTKIAELVLRERENVALEWKDAALEAPKHHMKIQKLRLSLMMRGDDNSNNDNQGKDNRADSYHDPGPGAFE